MEPSAGLLIHDMHIFNQNFSLCIFIMYIFKLCIFSAIFITLCTFSTTFSTVCIFSHISYVTHGFHHVFHVVDTGPRQKVLGDNKSKNITDTHPINHFYGLALQKFFRFNTVFALHTLSNISLLFALFSQSVQISGTTSSETI